MEKGFLLKGADLHDEDSDSSEDVDRDSLTEDDKLAMIFVQ